MKLNFLQDALVLPGAVLSCNATLTQLRVLLWLASDLSLAQKPKQLAKLPDGIVGLQRTAHVEELATWYSLADVFVNPTYEDTYPTTNLEALSCGAPVVTYRTGGSPESVTAETGRVVEKGDLDALVRAIDELCAEDRDAMRRRCRDYAEAHFDKRSCFAKYLDLYEKLINKSK